MLINLGRSANTLTNWFKASGLVVNELKTEFVVFHKCKKVQPTIQIGEERILAKTNMKALGITLDCNLNWECHINNVTKACYKTNMGFKIFKKYFTKEELLKLATSFYYSKLYYAAVVWQLPTLSTKLQKTLLSLSSLVLKTITGHRCNQEDKISFMKLHRITNRATPTMMAKYIQVTNLHRIMANKVPENVYLDLLVHHVENRRHYKPSFMLTNSTRVGRNIFRNRIRRSCDEISGDMTILSFNQLKIQAKKDFLIWT